MCVTSKTTKVQTKVIFCSEIRVYIQKTSQIALSRSYLVCKNINIIELIKQVEKKRYNARLAEHFIVFCKEFNKFNNTIAQMLDSIYYMTLKLF